MRSLRSRKPWLRKRKPNCIGYTILSNLPPSFGLMAKVQVNSMILCRCLSYSDKAQTFEDWVQKKRSNSVVRMAQVTSKYAALELTTSDQDFLIKKMPVAFSKWNCSLFLISGFFSINSESFSKQINVVFKVTSLIHNLVPSWDILHSCPICQILHCHNTRAASLNPWISSLVARPEPKWRLVQCFHLESFSKSWNTHSLLILVRPKDRSSHHILRNMLAAEDLMWPWVLKSSHNVQHFY